MPCIDVIRETRIVRTPRVIQLEGMFDVAPEPHSRMEWKVKLPIEDRPWSIGLIVGPSGCGKTSIATELFGHAMAVDYDWDTEKSILDSFPSDLGIKDITSLLSSVGFSSPPSWLRPFGVLSNGEQFRVSIARGLAEQPDLLVVDEFTSVVDRTVAKIGSAAIAKAIRRRDQQFVAVACHYDIIDWLQPDWIYDPAQNHFSWRARDCLRRPEIQLTIRPAAHEAWKLFGRHHYLSTNLHRATQKHTYVAYYDDQPCALTAVLVFPNPKGSQWREHRTVCLPDFQGVGIGNAMSEAIASAYKGYKGMEYISTTGNPAMVRHRAKSKLWAMNRKPSIPKSRVAGTGLTTMRAAKSHNRTRLTANFKYIGPPNPDLRLALGIGL